MTDIILIKFFIKIIVLLLLFRLVVHPLIYAILSDALNDDDDDDEIDIIDEDELLDMIGRYLYLKVFPVMMLIVYLVLYIKN